jgi:two-component system chemotaxis sensor kinase CheA
MSDDFETELKAGFLEEASQLLSNAEQSFLSLESDPGNPAIIENIFRIAHNIKGSSRAVGFDALGAFTHEFESFLLRCKSGEIPLTQQTISLLLKCNDHVNHWLETLKTNHQGSISNDELIQEILNFKPDAAGATVEAIETPEEGPAEAPVPSASSPAFDDAPAAEAGPSPSVEPISLEAHRTASATTTATSATSATAATAQPAAGASKAPSSSPAASDESIRVSLSRLEKLLNYVGEMVILQTVLKEQSYADNPTLLRKSIHQMGKVTKEIQDLSMSLRMVPLKQTFQKMQRIVRDTSASLGKKVQFTLQGEETEVDKTIIERLSDPLVHLIRNAVDHGVESPEVRVKSGKAETGSILLSAFHQSGSLVIEIKDDGAGINADRLRAKAREKGILGANATIPDKEAYNLIFHSGFSTKEVVTDVSGRGVGMDVVKTNIEQLQGEIQIETVLGQGTCFRVRLPLTLAIIDGMIIRSQKERYIIPLSHVHESLRPKNDDVHFVSGLGEVLTLRGEKIPLYRLSSIFTPSAPPVQIQDATAIVVRTEQKVFSVLVDDIIGQNQVVIKQLGEEHRDLKGISGSAILGDGRPALILELSELIKKAKIQNPNLNQIQTQPLRRVV